MDYQGWILLEARTNPADQVVDLKEQCRIFAQLIGRISGWQQPGIFRRWSYESLSVARMLIATLGVRAV